MNWQNERAQLLAGPFDQKYEENGRLLRFQLALESARQTYQAGSQ